MQLKFSASKPYLYALAGIAGLLIIIIAAAIIASFSSKGSTAAKTLSSPTDTLTPQPVKNNELGKEYDAYKGIIMVSVLSVQHGWDDPKLEADYQSQTSSNAVSGATPPKKQVLVKVKYRNTSNMPALFSKSKDMQAVLSLDGLSCVSANGYSEGYTSGKTTYPSMDTYGGITNRDFAPEEVREGYIEFPDSCQYFEILGAPGHELKWGPF